MKSSKSPEELSKIVAEFEASGVSQAEFCRSNNINPKTFNTWRKRFSKSKSKSARAKGTKQPTTIPAARTLTPVPKSAAGKQATTVSPSFGLLHVVLPNKAEIRYQCSNKEALVAAIKAVADLDLQN
jgi:transposase-like protein